MSTYSRSTIKSNPLLETYRVTLVFMGIAAAFALVLTVLTVVEVMGGMPPMQSGTAL